MSDKSKEIWDEIAKDEEMKRKVMRESFVHKTNNHREGISSDREKFIKDLNTGSPKVLPANTRDDYVRHNKH